MGSFPNAAVRIQVAVNATNFEDTLQFTTSVGNYATDVGGIASTLWQYLYTIQGNVAATPSTTLKWINATVRIDDVSAPRTPYGVYTTYSTATPGNSVAAFQENQHFRWNFSLGPFDFADQPTLAAALQAQIAQAVSQTPNY